jgi:transketolase
MPSTTVFDRQDLAYRRSVLPDGIKRVAVEAGATAFWWKYVGLDGAVIGMDSFGDSAPASALFQHFGFTAERIAETARQLFCSARGFS